MTQSMGKSLLFWLVLIALTAAIPAGAIVRRHDRADALYLEMAKAYPMVCRAGGGMGTLITPEWVVTAGHVAKSLPANAGVVSFGDRKVPVSGIHVHPDYFVKGKHRDIALLKLEVPVEDIAPAHLYRGFDELGQGVTFVGDGWTGDGRTGPSKGERTMRAARNTVTEVTPGWISFLFDAPPAGDDMEGISGPGDSGGPAFIERGDSLFVAGVSAWNDGKPQCVYGTTEHYSRVSDELTWIEGVMSGTVSDVTKPLMMKMKGDGEEGESVEVVEPESVPLDASQDGKTWGAGARLTTALNSGDEAAFISLFTERLAEERRAAGDPLENMIKFMGGVVEVRGPIERFHPLRAQGLRIEESRFPMRPVLFHLHDGMPGYFGLTLNEAGKIDHLSLFVMENICRNGKTCGDAVPLDDLVPGGR